MKKQVPGITFFILLIISVKAQDHASLVDRPCTFEILSRTGYVSAECGFTTREPAAKEKDETAASYNKQFLDAEWAAIPEADRKKPASKMYLK